MRIERSETMCINKYENWDCSDYYWPLSLNLVALYIVYKVKTAERLKCCGMKGRTVVAHGYQKTKKLVWHGRGKCCRLWPPAFPRSNRTLFTAKDLWSNPKDAVRCVKLNGEENNDNWWALFQATPTKPVLLSHNVANILPKNFSSLIILQTKIRDTSCIFLDLYHVREK